MNKKCSRCNKTKDLGRFSVSRGKARAYCKDCENEDSRRRRKAKRDADRARRHVTGGEPRKTMPHAEMSEVERQRRLRAAEGMNA